MVHGLCLCVCVCVCMRERESKERARETICRVDVVLHEGEVFVVRELHGDLSEVVAIKIPGTWRAVRIRQTDTQTG